MERRERRQFQESINGTEPSETWRLLDFSTKIDQPMPERGTVIRVYIQHLVGSTLNHSTFDFGYAVQGYVVRHGPPRKKPFLLSLFLSLFSTLNPLTVKIAPTTEYAAQHREPSPISLHIVKCCCCLGKWKCRRWRRSFAPFAAAVPICRSLGPRREPVGLATMYIEFIYYEGYVLYGSSG